MRPELNSVIERLKKDSLSSSSEMVRTVFEDILNIVSATEAEWYELGAAIENARPSMAAFHNIGKCVKDNAASGTLSIRREIAAMASREKGAAAAIAQRATKLPGNVFITLSYSGTVMNALLEIARTRHLKVIVLQSLPLGEGGMTCAKLAQAGIDVEMVDDSMAFAAVAGADQCLVGADAVTPKGVVNKVGTASIALAARHHRKGCHVLTSTLKMAPIKAHDLMLSEVAGEYRTRHQVFELTPLDLFTGFITDEGQMSAAEIAGLLR
jgi:translation initiation factor 2B subunit (eIF-2B alpha/beta/delta family)